MVDKIHPSKLHITVMDLTIYVVCGMVIGILGRESQQRRSDFPLLGGLMNSLKLFPFMPKGILSTDEEVNSATASGMYHVFGRDGISVVSNYSIMIVFNDGQGYVIQMTFRLGEDVVGFRRNYDGKWGDFRSFVLAS